MIGSPMPYNIWNSYRSRGTLSRSAVSSALAIDRTLWEPTASVTCSWFSRAISTHRSKFASVCDFRGKTGISHPFCRATTVSYSQVGPLHQADRDAPASPLRPADQPPQVPLRAFEIRLEGDPGVVPIAEPGIVQGLRQDVERDLLEVVRFHVEVHEPARFPDLDEDGQKPPADLPDAVLVVGRPDAGIQGADLHGEVQARERRFRPRSGRGPAGYLPGKRVRQLQVKVPVPFRLGFGDHRLPQRSAVNGLPSSHSRRRFFRAVRGVSPAMNVLEKRETPRFTRAAVGRRFTNQGSGDVPSAKYSLACSAIRRRSSRAGRTSTKRNSGNLERRVPHHPFHHPARPPSPVEEGRRVRPHAPEDLQPLRFYGIPGGIRPHASPPLPSSCRLPAWTRRRIFPRFGTDLDVAGPAAGCLRRPTPRGRGDDSVLRAETLPRAPASNRKRFQDPERGKRPP